MYVKLPLMQWRQSKFIVGTNDGGAAGPERGSQESLESAPSQVWGSGAMPWVILHANRYTLLLFWCRFFGGRGEKILSHQYFLSGALPT